MTNSIGRRQDDRPGPHYSREARWRRTSVLAASGFVGLAILTYAPMLLFDRLLVNADVFLAYLPAHLWLAAGLRAGELWLWTPHLLTGFPLAFTEYGWFYPPTWLGLLVAPGPRGYWVAVALHAAAAGIATYGLARSWGRSPAAAGIAGAVYQLSGTVAGGAALLNFGTVFWALPFLCWCADGLRRAAVNSHRVAWQTLLFRCLLAAAAVGLIALSGHPQLVALVCVGAGVYAVVTTAAVQWSAVTSHEPRVAVWRVWIAPVALLAAGLAAAPLAAIRIMPTLAVATLSPRGQGLADAAAAVGSAPPWALAAGLTLPGLEVLPALSPTWVAYVGIVPLALAGYAVWRWRARPPLAPRHSRLRGNPPPGHKVLLLTYAASGLILACGSFTPLYPLLLEVPGFALFRDPTRWLILWVFATALLAADGYDAWRASGGAEHAVAGQSRTTRGPKLRPCWTDSGDLRPPEFWPATPGTVRAALPRSPRDRGRWALLAVVLIVAGHLVGTGALVFGRNLLLEQVGQPLAQRLAADPARAFTAARYETTFAAYLTQAQRALDPRQLAVLGPLVGLVAAGWWFWSRWAQTRRMQPFVVLAVVIAPLLLFMWSRFPTVPPSAGADELAQVAALPGLREGSARVWSWKLRAAAYELNLATLAAQGNAPAATFALQRASLTPNWGLAVRVPQLGGYENLLSVRQAVVAGATHSERAAPVQLPQPRLAPGQLPQGLLEALAIRYLVLARDAQKKPHLDMHRWRPLRDGAAPAHAGTMEVWVNSRAQPRAYLVPAARVVNSAAAAWEAVAAPSFDPRRTVVLEGVDSRFRGNDESRAGDDESRAGDGGSGAGSGGGRAANDRSGAGEREQPVNGQDTPGSVRLTSARPERIAIAVEAATDAWLVHADAWFPGWTATLDGVPTPVLRANYLVRAVAVPAGEHEIVFSYDPPDYATGRTISIAAWSVLGAALVAVVLRGRRRRLHF